MAEYKVMVIDDDPDDRLLFCEVLQMVSGDLHCILAKNGDQALSMLTAPSSELPDMIFLDINMPLLNGWQFLVEIRKYPRMRSVPICMYSTTSDQREVDLAYQLGVVLYCVKPTDPMELKTFFSDLYQRGLETNALERGKYSLLKAPTTLPN